MRELQGIYPAIVTAFDNEGAFDPEAMRRIVRHQLKAGAHGFYVCGGTGEGLLLTREERQAVLETVLDEVNGRAGVIAHIGAYHTADTIALASHASQAGADAIAALPPAYFYRPDAPALVHYYTDVAEAVEVPLLIYNIPQRTGITMTRELFAQLLEVENIVGMKDSSGDIFALSLFLNGEEKPVIFNGEDTMLAAGLMVGACGGIGASYNMMPHLFVALWNSFQAGELEEVGKIQSRINQLIDAILLVDLFAGLKQILAWMGMECGVPRTPNRPLTEEETTQLRRSLEKVGFFEGL
jgi:N-acetylneuraminate lyase